MLGVLGGMGPLATVDFLEKLVTETKSLTDQQHIPTVIWSVPQIPDRSDCIMHGGENPLPELRRGLRNLQALGATAIAIPCNTAHFWYDTLIDGTGSKILHIVDAVVDQLYLSGLKRRIKTVGIIATTGTIFSNIYQHKLELSGYDVVVPTEEDQREVMRGIGLAKSGNITISKEIFLYQISKLRMQGADIMILACTEVPAVLEGSDEFIDSNRALARRCISWFEATHNGVAYQNGTSRFIESDCHIPTS